MGWHLLEQRRITKEESTQFLGKAQFYADHNLDSSIVGVLKRLKYDVETAAEVGAEGQPDEFQYRRAFRSKRVLLTQDKHYLDSGRFPLSQTRGVIVFNIDTASTAEIARALEVVDVILGGLAPLLGEAKVILNADYTLTYITRVRTDGDIVENRTRYRLDTNGRDIWVWEED